MTGPQHNVLGLWVQELYLGALTMWPDLTYQQFAEAATTWVERQPTLSHSLLDTANGIEAELRSRYGDPVEEDDQ